MHPAGTPIRKSGKKNGILYKMPDARTADICICIPIKGETNQYDKLKRLI